jgi:cbb3-type cytochrome oxidase subunit 3
MLLIFLEALGALLLLVLIVWWTMFSGRRKGELDNDREEQTTQAANERDKP